MPHEPSVQLAAKASTGFWVFGNFLDKGIDFIEPAARCCNVTVSHVDNMINDGSVAKFRVHQFGARLIADYAARLA